MDRTLAMSLIGSGVGTILALAICRLFDWVRRTIPEPVAFCGTLVAVLTGFVSILNGFVMAATCLPFLLCGGIAGCQRRDPAKSTIVPFFLFGILTIELLFALLSLYFLINLPMIGDQTLVMSATAALFLTLTSEEAFGYRRRRMTLR